MKKVLVVIAVIALLAVAAGAGFQYGKMYQSNQANQIRSQFLRSRGINPGNGYGSGGARAARFGGGVFGQLKNINGNTLTVSTQNGDETVDLTANTQIEKTTAGTTADLKTGEQLIVRGQRDSSGTVAAETVQINNNGAPRSTPAP
ncbi:MAG: DUF5666 domain-containing protein [Anaerolineales bacterium]|jgi:type II secretory pathway pseudopilin PulG